MRKRSNRKPRHIRVDNMAYVRTGFVLLSSLEDQYLKIKAEMHSSMNVMVKGKGTAADIKSLFNVSNMAQSICHITGLGDDYKDVLDAGHAALETLGFRAARTGSFTMTAGEITAINAMIEIHEAQLTKVTVTELEKACQVINNTPKTLCKTQTSEHGTP
jgi:hypothetical protein